MVRKTATLLAAACASALAADPCVLENGHVRFEVGADGKTTMAGDLGGAGNYGHEVLADMGIARVNLRAFGRQDVARMQGCEVQCAVTTAADGTKTAQISNLKDTCEGRAAFTEAWTASLAPRSSFVNIKAEGTVDQASQPDGADWHVRRFYNFDASSLYNLYDGGVVQMKQGANAGKTYYATEDALPRFYALGGFGPPDQEAGARGAAVVRGAEIQKIPTQVVSLDRSSSVQEFPAGSLQYRKDVWGMQAAPVLLDPAVTSWTHEFKISANNHDFPIFHDGLSMGSTDDLAAFMTGVYASPVGQFVTHKGLVQAGESVAQMATTIGYPNYGYSNLFNFFDPDNYMSTSALVYSGDAYLQEQVKNVIERSGSFLKADNGQLPHHFIGTSPTYQAISGEVQTGPNVFWILSALNYAKLSGDLEWLRGYLPTLRRASEFLNQKFVAEQGLYNAPGSLMIDVFIRGNFSTDTNAMLVGFFRDFAEAETAVGNATRAQELKDMADALAAQVEAKLWKDDHYITQLNQDGTTRDFVDYDANFIAAAHRIPSADRAAAIFNRIDKGTCPAAHTWVSELYYGPQDTTSGNIGDSWTAMGRVTWFDSLSRKHYPTEASLQHFNDVIMNPLVRDVQKYTWMHERYNCDGTPMTNRTAYYFEYPSTTAMLLHRVRYGIDIGLNTVEIAPFGPTDFTYNTGVINVRYSSAEVAATLAGNGPRTFEIGGLKPSTEYSIATTGCAVARETTASTDASGRLVFKASLGDGSAQCTTTATAGGRLFIPTRL